MAFIALKPPIPAAPITDSAPPVIIISALPSFKVSMAVTIAFVLEAHALTTAKLGPRNPCFIEICPAAISNIIFGIKKGLNLGVPSPCTKLVTSSLKVFKPPIPLAKITPTRSWSTLFSVIPASATAWSLATKAICAKRSSFLASLRSMNSVASKPFISQANLVLNFEASNCVIISAPDTPLIKLSQ